MKNKLLAIAIFLFVLILISPACNFIPGKTTTSNNTTGISSSSTSTTSTKSSIASLPAIGADSLALIYQDDFSSAASGWSTASDSDVAKSYNNGEFCFSIHTPNLIYNAGNYAVGVQSNFIVSVDVRTKSTGSDIVYGLEFRRNENGDFYYFSVTNNQYSLQKYVNREWASLQADTKSGYIRTDGSANQIKIACLGKTIEVYANGQRLTTVTDDSLTSGDIYLAAMGTGADILFDNFQLYHFTSAYIMQANPSLPVITTSSLPAGEVGVNYNQTVSVSGGTSPYTWSLIDGNLPDGLSLVASSGVITGIPGTEGKYNFTLQVSTKTGVSTLPLSITITSLVISTEHLGDGTMNSNYNFALNAAGGVPPYTWSIESGNLPDGLILNASTGTITGIPAKAGGPTTLFFKVTDGTGAAKTRGLSVFINLGDFQKLDAWVLNVPQSSAASIKDLVAYLLQPCQNDMEKARVIYRWIAEYISYDEETGKRIEAGIYTDNPDQNAEAVFARRNAVCEGYSRLFKQMCDDAGLQSVYITGWGKVDYAYLSAAYYKKNHAWNAVQINGTWRLVDSTWGAGYVDSFTRDFWFLTAPEQFVYTHCPDDAKWQLLPTPYSSAAIAQHPVVKPAFFEYGLQIGENDYPYYTVQNSLFLTVPTPPDAILTAEVFQNGQELTGNYIFCQRKDDASYEVHARFPVVGKYDLKIYAKWQNESGLYPMAIIYQVNTSQNLDMSEFPKEYDLFNTRGAYLYTFVPGQVQSGTSYNYKISVPGAQAVAFITNLDGGSPVLHKLTKNGQIFEGTIDIVQGTMRISAKFPGEDTYWALLEYTGQ